MNNNWNLFPSLLNVAHKRQIDSYDKATTPPQEKSEGSALLLQEQLHLRVKCFMNQFSAMRVDS